MAEHSSTQSTAPRISVGLRYMAVSTFFFSLMGMLVKVAGQHLSSQEIVFARSFVVLVLTVVMIRRAGVSLWGQDKVWLCLRGLTGFIALSCFYYGVTHLPLADATLIMYTNPVFTGILAAIFLGETLTAVDIGGVVCSLAGVVLVAQPSVLFGGAARLDPVAVAVALGGAVFAATAYTIVRKLRQTEHDLTVVFYFTAVATPASVPLAWPSARLPSWPDLAVLVGVGLSAFLAQVAMTRGLHLEKAGKATSVSYLQVVFAFIWGMIFFDEYPTIFSIIGAALIVASTVAIAWWQGPSDGDDASAAG